MKSMDHILSEYSRYIKNLKMTKKQLAVLPVKIITIDEMLKYFEKFEIVVAYHYEDKIALIKNEMFHDGEYRYCI